MTGGKRAFGLVVLAGALAAPAGLSAQEGGPYIGLSFGQSKFKDWCSTGGDPTASFSSCKDTDTGWKLLGGYRFNRYLAAEGTYIDWGEVTASGTLGAPPTPFNVAASQTSIGIAAVGSLPVSPQLALFAKAGFLQTEQETRRVTPNPTTVSRDETEFHYGLGATFSPLPSWALRAEWENTEKLKVQMLSLGVEYRF